MRGRETETTVTTVLPLSLSHLVIAVCLALAARLTYDRVLLTTELRLEAAALNNTGTASDREVLFFNRVPKVGSQTIMDLLKELQNRNNFTHYVDSVEIKQAQGEKTILPRAEQIVYAEMFLKNFTPPASYSKHISYIEFKSLGEEYYRPIYVNFVREPVQRIISWYYYIRAPWYQFTTDDKNVSKYVDYKPGFGSSPMRFKMSFDDCVLSGDPECTYISGHDHVSTGEGGSHASQMMFFCGHNPHCRVINGEDAFRDAKKNVEKQFAVVGILEEMEKSLLVMEHYVPRFFNGVSWLYKRRNEKMKQVNKNIYRPEVGSEIRDMVKRNVSREVEFYHFCKQRLHKQFLALVL